MGHLLHMPAHVYMRTGEYVKCVTSSLAAIENDIHLEQQCLIPYFPTHNKALLVTCALYAGDLRYALAYSQPVATLSPVVARGMSSMYAVPQVRVRRRVEALAVYKCLCVCLSVCCFSVYLLVLY